MLVDNCAQMSACKHECIALEGALAGTLFKGLHDFQKDNIYSSNVMTRLHIELAGGRGCCDCCCCYYVCRASGLACKKEAAHADAARTA